MDWSLRLSFDDGTWTRIPHRSPTFASVRRRLVWDQSTRKRCRGAVAASRKAARKRGSLATLPVPLTELRAARSSGLATSSKPQTFDISSHNSGSESALLAIVQEMHKQPERDAKDRAEQLKRRVFSRILFAMTCRFSAMGTRIWISISRRFKTSAWS